MRSRWHHRPSLPNRPDFALAHVWRGSALDSSRIRSSPAIHDPGFDLRQIPNNASWRQVEAPGKLATLLHFVDGRISEWHDPTLLGPPNCPFDLMLSNHFDHPLEIGR